MVQVKSFILELDFENIYDEIQISIKKKSVVPKKEG